MTGIDPTSDFAEEVWRRSNHLAWTMNYRGHARAVELMREARMTGRADEARLWTAVEERLRPPSPDSTSGPARHAARL